MNLSQRIRTLMCVGAVLHGLAFSMSAQDLPFQDRLLPALLNKNVQTHLELTDAQNDKLKKMLTDIQAKQKEFGKELQAYKKEGASREKQEEKRSELISQLDSLKKEFQEEAMDLLLPHQIKRLKQVTVQVMMRESAKQNRTQSGLLTDEMISFLELDEKQQKKIRDKSKELQQKLLAEIKELQKKYTKELLRELTAKQKKKYEEAIGEPIDR